MKACVNFSGFISELFSIVNKVKQNTAFFPYILQQISRTISKIVKIPFRTSGKVFDLTRFNAKSKTSYTVVREFLDADNVDLMSHAEDLQGVLNLFSRACALLGITVSLRKAIAMFTSPQGQPVVESNIFSRIQYLIWLFLLFILAGFPREKANEASENLKTACGLTGVSPSKPSLASMKHRPLSAVFFFYSSETWATNYRHLKALEKEDP